VQYRARAKLEIEEKKEKRNSSQFFSFECLDMILKIIYIKSFMSM
jgi:hypothetical protein